MLSLVVQLWKMAARCVSLCIVGLLYSLVSCATSSTPPEAALQNGDREIFGQSEHLPPLRIKVTCVHLVYFIFDVLCMHAYRPQHKVKNFRSEFEKKNIQTVGAPDVDCLNFLLVAGED